MRFRIRQAPHAVIHRGINIQIRRFTILGTDKCQHAPIR